jgi:predicted HTH domain antitoxin
MLYPYIQDKIISHGKAAEVLGIKKLDLIQLYADMGIPYFDMDIQDVEEDMETIRALKELKV